MLDDIVLQTVNLVVVRSKVLVIRLPYTVVQLSVYKDQQKSGRKFVFAVELVELGQAVFPLAGKQRGFTRGNLSFKLTSQ